MLLSEIEIFILKISKNFSFLHKYLLLTVSKYKNKPLNLFFLVNKSLNSSIAKNTYFKDRLNLNL